MSAARRAVSTAEQATAEAEAAERFLADLIARGEAVEKTEKPTPGGPPAASGGAAGRAEKAGDRQNDALPPGVTHEIVRRDDDEPPVVRRRRYSAF